MSDRPVLAVIFGGRSVEHEVSLVSGRTVLEGAAGRYDIVPVLVDHDGRWYTGAAETLLAERGGTPPGRRVFAPTDPTQPWLRDESGQAASPPLAVVFPIVHGTGGEDGRLQAQLEAAEISYVGAGVLSSALCFDKDLAKRVLAQAGLPVVPWESVSAAEWGAGRKPVLDRAGKVGYPVFTKPANGGSSVGITRCETREELERGLQLALELDTRALVEAGLEAREIECAVLGNHEPACAAPAEIVAGRSFYDYEAKYGDAGSEVHVPASLDADTAREARELALAVYRALGIEGMARVDLLLDRTGGRLWVNEANTLPGFTEISVFPKAWEHEGLPLPALVDRLVELALERSGERKALRTRWRPSD